MIDEAIFEGRRLNFYYFILNILFLVSAPQQRSSSKPKTGSSKPSQQSPATQQSAKSPRVSMPSDAR